NSGRVAISLSLSHPIQPHWSQQHLGWPFFDHRPDRPVVWLEDRLARRVYYLWAGGRAGAIFLRQYPSAAIVAAGVERGRIPFPPPTVPATLARSHPGWPHRFHRLFAL